MVEANVKEFIWGIRKCFCCTKFHIKRYQIECDTLTTAICITHAEQVTRQHSVLWAAWYSVDGSKTAQLL